LFRRSIPVPEVARTARSRVSAWLARLQAARHQADHSVIVVPPELQLADDRMASAAFSGRGASSTFSATNK